MSKTPRGFRAALLVGWIALGAAGVLYARVRGIPDWAALPMLSAILIEYPFYLVPAFPTLREQFGGRRLPVYLLAAAVLPYLACCLGAIPFSWLALAKLAGMALVFAFWYRVLPRHAVFDLLFLSMIPAVLLGRYFVPIYVAPMGRFKDIVFLGHVSLIVISVMVLLVERRVDDAGYGFIPTRRDWLLGVKHFVYFVPLGALLAWAFHATTWVGPAPVWKIAGMFPGFLWTIALSEEFFVRGVLLHWLEDWTRRPRLAVALSAALFGLIHIAFRGWPWVLIAGVLGWFCARARLQAGSIRAGMVTHTLVFTMWRGFFS